MRERVRTADNRRAACSSSSAPVFLSGPTTEHDDTQHPPVQSSYQYQRSLMNSIGPILVARPQLPVGGVWGLWSFRCDVVNGERDAVAMSRSQSLREREIAEKKTGRGLRSSDSLGRYAPTTDACPFANKTDAQALAGSPSRTGRAGWRAGSWCWRWHSWCSQTQTPTAHRSVSQSPSNGPSANPTPHPTHTHAHASPQATL